MARAGSPEATRPRTPLRHRALGTGRVVHLSPLSLAAPIATSDIATSDIATSYIATSYIATSDIAMSDIAMSEGSSQPPAAWRPIFSLADRTFGR
jgi:hypothetical protein